MIMKTSIHLSICKIKIYKVFNFNEVTVKQNNSGSGHYFAIKGIREAYRLS